MTAPASRSSDARSPTYLDAPEPPRSAVGVGRWPLLPIAPVIVLLIGIATAAVIAAVAAGQLQTASDEAATRQSKALAAALAARVRMAPSERRPDLLARAATRTDSLFVLVDRRGSVMTQETATALSPRQLMAMVDAAEGFTDVGDQRMHFAVSTLSPPLQELSVIAFVTAPAPAKGTVRLSNAVGVLTFLLLAVAVTVTLVFTKSTQDDVAFVGDSIAAMASGSLQEERGAAKVPLRSLDQVGLLTEALNVLIERFAAAERSYEADLSAAAQLDKERSAFLAGLSHELRTPLNAILGFTHLLESEVDGPLDDEALEALAAIRTSGEHLKSLIDDILDLSAMETGQLRLTRTVVDVHHLAQEVMRETRGTMKGRPVELSVRGDEHVFAWADPRRLRQVLTNLVSNAVKATAEGKVEITVSKRRDQACFEVTDTGRGIAPDVLSAIFQPYRQAGDATARRGGAGLGLAIARRLVLLHGGTIDAESALGEGSRFMVEVPDESHSATVPRDSIVPFTEGGEEL